MFNAIFRLSCVTLFCSDAVLHFCYSQFPLKVLFYMPFSSLIQKIRPRASQNDRAKAILFRSSIISYDVVFVNFSFLCICN